MFSNNEEKITFDSNSYLIAIWYFTELIFADIYKHIITLLLYMKATSK